MIRKYLGLLALAAATLCLPVQGADHRQLTFGATSGPFSDMIRYSVKPWLEARGYSVKLIEFNDYVQPNLALAQGDLDANVFQHVIYLHKFAEDHGLQIEPVAQVPTEPMGLYSRKRHQLSEIADGARIALPNDPTNEARALGMLSKLGWVSLKPNSDPIRASEKDIAENPRHLQLLPLEAASLPRSLDDTDYSFINGNYAYSSGLKLKDALSIEDLGDRYINVVAVRSADKGQAYVADIVAAFHSPEFKSFIEQHYPEFSKPKDWTAGR